MTTMLDLPPMENDTEILVVEDDPAIAHSLADGITQQGFRVHWEPTGNGGVTYARDKDPGLVILDVRLPDGSGFDFCREMRRLGLRLPILMLTVRSEELDEVLGLEVEACGELPSVEADLLIVGDLVVDRSRARITRGDKTINLTPTEFRLLVFFAQHPGQVFSRTQLMDNVWGCSADYCDNKRVNVHMRRLREKIEMEPNAPQLLLTVPGIGYRLAVSA